MEILCIIYYTCSYISTVPAVVKIIKTKSSNDYSLGNVLLSAIALTSWTIYIFSTKQSLAVYVGTTADAILGIIHYVVILRYYKFHKTN